MSTSPLRSSSSSSSLMQSSLLPPDDAAFLEPIHDDELAFTLAKRCVDTCINPATLVSRYGIRRLDLKYRIAKRILKKDPVEFSIFMMHIGIDGKSSAKAKEYVLDLGKRLLACDGTLCAIPRLLTLGLDDDGSRIALARASMGQPGALLSLNTLGKFDEELLLELALSNIEQGGFTQALELNITDSAAKRKLIDALLYSDVCDDELVAQLDYLNFDLLPWEYRSEVLEQIAPRLPDTVADMLINEDAGSPEKQGQLLAIAKKCVHNEHPMDALYSICDWSAYLKWDQSSRFQVFQAALEMAPKELKEMPIEALPQAQRARLVVAGIRKGGLQKLGDLKSDTLSSQSYWGPLHLTPLFAHLEHAALDKFITEDQIDKLEKAIAERWLGCDAFAPCLSYVRSFFPRIKAAKHYLEHSNEVFAQKRAMITLCSVLYQLDLHDRSSADLTIVAPVMRSLIAFGSPELRDQLLDHMMDTLVFQSGTRALYRDILKCSPGHLHQHAHFSLIALLHLNYKGVSSKVVTDVFHALNTSLSEPFKRPAQRHLLLSSLLELAKHPAMTAVDVEYLLQSQIVNVGNSLKRARKELAELNSLRNKHFHNTQRALMDHLRKLSVPDDVLPKTEPVTGFNPPAKYAKLWRDIQRLSDPFVSHRLSQTFRDLVTSGKLPALPQDFAGQCFEIALCALRRSKIGTRTVDRIRRRYSTERYPIFKRSKALQNLLRALLTATALPRTKRKGQLSGLLARNPIWKKQLDLWTHYEANLKEYSAAAEGALQGTLRRISTIPSLLQFPQGLLTKECLTQAKDNPVTIFNAGLNTLIDWDGPGTVSKRFWKVFGKRPHPDALFHYYMRQQGLMEVGQGELIAHLKRYIKAILTSPEAYRKERYATKDNPHLEKLAKEAPETFAKWKKNRRLPIAELMKSCPSAKYDERVVVDTDDDWLIFLMGTLLPGSCKSAYGDPTLSRSLLSDLMDGKNRLIAILNPEKGNRIEARALLRIFWDRSKPDAHKPVLLLEPIYPKTVDNNTRYALTKMARRRGKEMGLDVVIRDKAGIYSGQAESLGTPLPWEYSDSVGGELGEIMGSGGFTVENLRVI